MDSFSVVAERVGEVVEVAVDLSEGAEGAGEFEGFCLGPQLEEVSREVAMSFGVVVFATGLPGIGDDLVGGHAGDSSTLLANVACACIAEASSRAEPV